MSLTLTDPRTAEAFMRYAARSLRGAGCWSQEEWVSKANRLASVMNDEDAARALQMARAKRGYAFKGVCCKVCGTPLSAAESVAAGVGPECQAQRAGA